MSLAVCLIVGKRLCKTPTATSQKYRYRTVSFFNVTFYSKFTCSFVPVYTISSPECKHVAMKDQYCIVFSAVIKCTVKV